MFALIVVWYRSELKKLQVKTPRLNKTTCWMMLVAKEQKNICMNVLTKDGDSTTALEKAKP